MTTSTRIAVGAAVILAAGAGGFLAHRLTVDQPSTLVAVPEDAASPATDAPADTTRQRVIPERLPDIVLADREGVKRSLAEWSGRPLLVNFWATWCAPCRREIPLLQKLRKERAAQNIEVVGIAVDFREDVLKYAEDIGLDYPLLIGEEDGLQAADAFGMDLLLPFTVFSDRQARIVALKVGELHEDEAEFILDRIADVDADRLTLEDARQQIDARLRELAATRATQPSPVPTDAPNLDDLEH